MYTEEYKREAVRLAKESGNLSGTARNLGVNPTVLQRWKKAVQDDKPNPFPGKATRRSGTRPPATRERALTGGERDPKKGCGYLHCRPQ